MLYGNSISRVFSVNAHNTLIFMCVSHYCHNVIPPYSYGIVLDRVEDYINLVRV